MFPWIRELIDAVPDVWSPTLRPAGRRERVLGQLPRGLYKAFLATVWARERAERIAKEHEDEHRRGVELTRDCLSVRREESHLNNQAEILSAVVSEAIREHFSLPFPADVQIRSEGAVEVSSPQNEVMELLGELLGGSKRGPSGRMPRVAALLTAGFPGPSGPLPDLDDEFDDFDVDR